MSTPTTSKARSTRAVPPALSFTLAKGRYPYFFCLGRHGRQANCEQPYLDVETVEAAVERCWRTVVSRPVSSS